MGKEILLRIMLAIFILNLFSIALTSSVSEANDSIYIRSDGSIDPPTAPIQRNGNVYTLTGDIYDKTIIVEKDDIVMDGNKHTIQGTGIHLSKGLDLSNREGVTVKNIRVGGFYYGISLNSSQYNIISRNIIFGCTYVIHARESRYNKIFHNNFINQLNRVYRGINVWDNGYPYGGNYWSDSYNEDFYSGPHQDVIGSDGIGDLIRNIDEDNFDNYPLMGMYSIFNIMTQEETEHVCIISNSTILSFAYNSTDHAISFYAYGNVETLGFCRVCIPHALIEEPTVSVNNQNPLYVNYTLYDNGTHRWVYFSYEHSKHVIIVPARAGDLNEDGTVDIYDVVIIAAAFGSKPGDPNWNPVADLVQDDTIDIFDVVVVAKNFGKTA